MPKNFLVKRTSEISELQQTECQKTGKDINSDCQVLIADNDCVEKIAEIKNYGLVGE